MTKMKEVVFLFAGWNKTHAFDPVFSSKSAFERSMMCFRSLFPQSPLVVFTSPATEENVREYFNQNPENASHRLVTKNEWNTALLLSLMSQFTSDFNGDTAVFSFADLPFLDTELSKEVLACHSKYIAEYTFADGYPHGFAPEVIDRGSLSILSQLASEREAGKLPVTKDSIFSVMKTDLNAFEIESVIAPKDYRMLRLDFSCTKKAALFACKNLYEEALNKKTPFTASSLSDLAEQSPSVQRTIPAFYNVQLCQNVALLSVYNPYPDEFKKKNNFLPTQSENPNPKNMSLEAFRALVKDMADFSEEAVVSLSAWGEALLLPRLEDYVASVTEEEGLSVLIETDGMLLTQDLAQKIASCGKNKVTWIVSLDAFTSETFNSIHPNAADFSSEIPAFNRAVKAVELLAKYFPNQVYPQFLRMEANESELEPFWRFWHEKTSPSAGKVIVQKYDCFCNLLPQVKPADLSPLNRNPCWHLKRDLTILSDGSVPFCRETIFEHSVGNVFNEGIDSVWKKMQEEFTLHLKGQYQNWCRACDEYYTFNF